MSLAAIFFWTGSKEEGACPERSRLLLGESREEADGCEEGDDGRRGVGRDFTQKLKTESAPEVGRFCFIVVQGKMELVPRDYDCYREN